MNESQEAVWITAESHPIETLMKVIELDLRGRVVDHTAERVNAKLGSPMWYRLLGAYMAVGRRQYPLALTLKASPQGDGRWRIDARIEDMAGHYVVRVPRHEQAFRERTDATFTLLRRALRSDLATEG